MTRTRQLPWLAAVFVWAALETVAQAQTYTVVHRFTGPDGADPQSALIADPAGNVFSTTALGGVSGFGIVFRLGKAGLTVLYTFTGGADGRYPDAGLIRDPAGNLYGTTSAGGSEGVGVVFKLDPAGAETVLHNFTVNRGDGEGPWEAPGALIRNAAGDFFGTTTAGGASQHGTVFRLNKAGETVTYSFAGGTDGAFPYAGLVQDAAGNLYGTTVNGGATQWGTVFKLDTAGVETVLYTFTGGADGGNPYGGLIRDPAGNLYGTTAYGAAGSGTVFKLDTAGVETVLYTFTGGADGGNPYGGLIRDSAGKLYGTTSYGGAPFGLFGGGVVFKLDAASGTYTVLHSFTGGADGAVPLAGLLQAPAGNLYGTTSVGAGRNAACVTGCGIVFRIAP